MIIIFNSTLLKLKQHVFNFIWKKTSAQGYLIYSIMCVRISKVYKYIYIYAL